MTTTEMQASALSAEDVLKHWQGHRALTRRTIDAFPEDKLFTFSLGGMRPFSEMALEFIRMAVPIVDGVASGHWEEYAGAKLTTKAELLAVWDRHSRAKSFPVRRRQPAEPPERWLRH